MIIKLIELIDRKQDEDNSDDQDQSFKNLIEAIKHVRKLNPKQNDFLFDVINENMVRINMLQGYLHPKTKLFI